MKLFKSLAHILLSLAILTSTALASISNQTARIGPFIPNAIPATLSVTFPYQNASDLVVIDLGQGGVTRDPGDVLTLNSDYTVTGGGYNSTTQMQTGNVVLQTGGAHNVVAGDYIVILRNTPVTQTTTFSSTGILTGPMIEKALDKGITISQQLTEEASRALRFEPGETLDGTLLRSARSGKYLGFDSTGAIAYLTGGSGGGGATYTAGAGLQLNSNEFSVLPTQSFTDLTVTNPISGSIAGNAATATALATPRNINGVPFDGSAAITVPAAAGTLTGSALPAGVTSAPGLLSASIGTFGSMAVQSAAAVNISGGTINGAAVTGLPTPSATTDAATKAYVDSISAGITPRTGVVAATTANITLSGPQTIDGQSVIAGNRVLVKNQTAPAENGIYDVAAGAWSRSSDSNTAGKLLFGYYYFVSSGTTQGATSWFIQTAPVTLGVSSVVFAQFSASQNYTAGAGLALAGNVFSANQNLTISGGTVNNSPIGAVTPSTGAFTSLSSTSGALAGTFQGAIGGITPAAASTTTLTSTGQITFGTAGSGFNVQLKDFNSGVNRPWSIRDDAGIDRLRFSYSTADYAFWDVLKTSGANTVAQQNWYSVLGYTFNVAGAQKFAVTSTGINYTDIGTTSAGSGAFTTLSGSVTATGSSSSRTLANRFAQVINVKDFGALGDGTTNDTAAIAAAVAAIPISSGSALYFPGGVYRTDPIAIAGKSFFSIIGDGRDSTQLVNRTSGNVMYLRPSCSNVTIQDLTINNNNNARTAGQHGLVIGCSKVIISNVGVTKCGEYAVLTGWDQQAGVATAVTDIEVDNLWVYNTYADGMHFKTTTRGTLTNSIFVTDDDCIAVDNSSQITVSNCTGTARNDLGTTWGRGIAVFTGSTDVVVTGCSIKSTKQAGIRVELAGGAAPARVTFANNDVYNCGLSSDANINVEDGTDIVFAGGASRNAVSGNHLVVQKGTRITVKGMDISSTTNAYARGITTGDTSGSETIATFFISGNNFSFPLASQNEAIRLAKSVSGAYYSNVIISGNSGIMDSSEYLIYTRNMASTSKVYNNTQVGGTGCYFHDTGGGGSTPANGNNN